MTLRKPKTILTVLTSPRPMGVSYLNDTLTSLDRTGADLCDAKIVISDGPIERRIDWRSIVHEGPSCSSKAMWRTFEHALYNNFDQLLFCEDDILPANNAVARILEVGVPDDVFMMTFFDVDRLKPNVGAGIYRLPLRLYSCNQCLLIPRRSIEHLMRTGWQNIKASDQAISVLGAKSQTSYYGLHAPCLVEHVGAVSVATPNAQLRKGRVATNFCGADFNALDIKHFSMGAKARWREPERIREILKQIGDVWACHSDLTLPLLIANVAASSDLYTIEDDALVEQLRNFYNDGEQDS
jgi:hypothetical protein